LSARTQLRSVGARGVEICNQTVPHGDDDQRANFQAGRERFPEESLFGAHYEDGSAKRKIGPVGKEGFESLYHIFDYDLPLMSVQAEGEKLRVEYGLRVS
jgi:hypothetical protein